MAKILQFPATEHQKKTLAAIVRKERKEHWDRLRFKLMHGEPTTPWNIVEEKQP